MFATEGRARSAFTAEAASTTSPWNSASVKSFHDLAASGSGPEVVMEGLSEALVATAVGLFVAIPCVVGYNYLSGKARDLLARTESFGRIMLAQVRAQHAAAGRQ